MTPTLAWIVIAAPLSGLVALGLALLFLKSRIWTHDRSHLFISFAAGTLLSVAFLDLLPEAFEAFEEAEGAAGHGVAPLIVLAGFLLFFTIEKLILWYHCHEEKCDVHRSPSMILIGDTLHNFLDGVAIAVAFSISVPVGIATTVAVFFHEVPQEVADFSVLLSMLKTKVALMLNSLSALSSLVGALFAYYFASAVEGAAPYLIAVTAGGFIYISASDLIPEIHKETRRSQMWRQFLFFMAGFLAILFINGFGNGH